MCRALEPQQRGQAAVAQQLSQNVLIHGLTHHRFARIHKHHEWRAVLWPPSGRSELVAQVRIECQKFIHHVGSHPHSLTGSSRWTPRRFPSPLPDLKGLCHFWSFSETPSWISSTPVHTDQKVSKVTLSCIIGAHQWARSWVFHCLLPVPQTKRGGNFPLRNRPPRLPVPPSIQVQNAWKTCFSTSSEALVDPSFFKAC